MMTKIHCHSPTNLYIVVYTSMGDWICAVQTRYYS